MTSAIGEISQTKIYKKLRLESFRRKRLLTRPCALYKIKTTGLPLYLNNMLANVTYHYQTRNSEDLTTYQTRTNIFKYKLL